MLVAVLVARMYANRNGSSEPAGMLAIVTSALSPTSRP
jgi:hypothetical protein